MKKTILSIAFALIFCLVSVAATAESVSTIDATYEYLFANLLHVMSVDGQNDTVKLQNATVWKVNDSMAGFMFEGDDWNIMGEAMIDTGLIYKVSARLPFTYAGILATRLIAFTLSEEPDWDAFVENYTTDDTILAEKPLVHYVNTLNSGNSKTMIFEFTRTTNLDLNNAANAFNMKETISAMQAIQ